MSGEVRRDLNISREVVNDKLVGSVDLSTQISQRQLSARAVHKNQCESLAVLC